jgi:very-short-patch-repair endonuclease
MAQRSNTLQQFARSMRHQPTRAEDRIWSLLRGRRLDGYKFRRQCPVGPYIADFICLELRMIIEMDGEHHRGVDAHGYDERRSDDLIQRGFHVIRIPNKLLAQDPRMVEEIIRHAMRSCDG